MKLRKIACLITAAAAALSMCGCSVKLGTNKKIKDDAIVAHATGETAQGKTGLDITYGEFKHEYLYYLKSRGITDDSEESVAETCKSQRSTIIDYLISERIILDKAKELGLDVLTDEELAAVDEEFDAQVAEQVEYFGSNADYGTLAEGETVTDKEKEERGNADFDAYLADCGLTRDDLYMWQVSAAVTNKVVEETVKDITIERSTAEAEYDKLVQSTKELYESDPATYESGKYSSVWLPEGARRIKHVLLKFDDTFTDELTAARENNDDEGADAMRAQKAEEMAQDTQDILNMLENGADIDGLITVYSGDATGSSLNPDGYLLLPNSTAFMEEFREAAFELENVGDVTTCVTDYGVHIMLYVSDAVITDEQKNEFIDYFDETLNSNAKNEYFNAMLEQWEQEYAFETDYEALKIDAPAESAESAATEQAG